MKFLYFGDKHERRTAPENRMDDYNETQKNKTREIISLGRKHGVSAFLQPGDFFDTANPGNDFVSEIAGMWGGGNAHDLLSKFRSGQMKEEEVLKAMHNYIPMIGVAGNHELYGNNINTLDKTAIGLLNKWGLMRFATKENPYFFYTEDGMKIAITGTHYHLDIDTPEHINDYIVDEKLGDFHIHIVHGMLSNKSMGSFIRHTLVEEISDTKADLTISGHDHIGFPLTEIDGKWFVNPGGVTRMSNNLKEINRKPKVLLIEITKREGLKLEEIFLKSAPPGDLVLNRKKIEERKKRENRIEDFKKAVKDAGVRKSTDIIEIIRDMSDSKEIPSTFKEDLVNRVTDKKVEMNPDSQMDVSSAYIEKVVLENFQAHAYNEFDFASGFNMFVGESGTAKTSLLRAFNWVYENKPSGKGIIRRGSDFAKVTVYLSNGFVVSRYAEQKQGGKNGYEIIDPTTGAIEFHNTKILPEVQKLLGFNHLIIDKDLQFNLNFMKQGTGWFLIGDNYSAPQKAKIIGSISGVQYADAVVRDFDSEERKLNDALKRSNEDLYSINESIGKYDHLEVMEKSIRNMEALIKETEELEERKKKILILTEKRKVQIGVINENLQTLNSLENIDGARGKLQILRKQEGMRNQLVKVIETQQTVQSKYNMTVEVIEQTKEIVRAKKGTELTLELQKRKQSIEAKLKSREVTLSRIEEEDSILESTNQLSQLVEGAKEIHSLIAEREKVSDKLARAMQLENKRDKNKTSLKAIQETIEHTNEIEDAKRYFDELKKMSAKRGEIEKTLATHKRYLEVRDKEAVNVINQNESIQSLVEEYQGLLEQEGACPTCFGAIDKSTVKRIVKKYMY